MDSDIRIELADVEGCIKQDIDNKATQKQVAKTYALGLRSSWPTDWKKVNEMIVNRWSSAGLERIKTMAWNGSCFEASQ